MTEPSDTPCSVDGCDRAAGPRLGLCNGHYFRKYRGQTVNVALRDRPDTPLDRLTEAALRYAEDQGNDLAEFERAKDNLRKAAVSYARSLDGLRSRGWRRKSIKGPRWRERTKT